MTPVVYGTMIDPVPHHELDDAFRVEELSKGSFVSVSIPNAADYIAKGSHADAIAHLRGRSRYWRRWADTMLPEPVWERLSLSPDKANDCVTVTMHLDANRELADVSLVLTTLEVTHEYSYQEADELIARPEEGFEYSEHLTRAWTLARELHARRFMQKSATRKPKYAKNGHLIIRRPKIYRTPAHMVVNELMVLTNIALSRYFADRGIPCLFRNQDAESMPKYYSFRPGWNAEYFTEAYGHWTTPLRRYAALVNNRILVSSIRNEEPPYTTEELESIARKLNDDEERERRSRKEESAEGYETAAYL